MTRRLDVRGRHLGDLGDVVDDGVELAREPRHLVVVQLDAREHAEMAYEFGGDFRHPSSLVRARAPPATGTARAQ